MAKVTLTVAVVFVIAEDVKSENANCIFEVVKLAVADVICAVLAQA